MLQLVTHKLYIPLCVFCVTYMYKGWQVPLLYTDKLDELIRAYIITYLTHYSLDFSYYDPYLWSTRENAQHISSVTQVCQIDAKTIYL